jgi:hypothetical protein
LGQVIAEMVIKSLRLAAAESIVKRLRQPSAEQGRLVLETAAELVAPSELTVEGLTGSVVGPVEVRVEARVAVGETIRLVEAIEAASVKSVATEGVPGAV